MKKILKYNVSDYLITFVLSAFFTLSITWNSYSSGFNKVNFLIYFILTYAILYFIWKKIKKVEIQSKEHFSKKEFFLYALIILIPIIVGIIAYYPGYGTPDTINQWNQVQTGVYETWHPILHTFIFLKLPSLVYNNFISATIFQSILVFLILLYFCYFCRKNFLSFKATVIVLLLFVFNPIFIKYTVTLWKDIPYSWSIFLMTLFLINIVISNGDWLKNNKNKFFFILSSIGILVLRHNGVAPFVLLFTALIIFYPKLRKFFTISFITILFGSYLITGPISNFFHVIKSENKSEILGLVNGQLSNYYNEGQVNFSEEELELLNIISPLENWTKWYNSRNFNIIKFQTESYTPNVNAHFTEILKLWLKKSIQNPKAFIKSYLNMTSPIWENVRSLNEVDTYQNDYQNLVLYKERKFKISDTFFRKLADYNASVNNSVIRWLFINFGEGFFLILFAFAIIMKRNGLNLKRWLPFVPVVINTLVIMCLITGEESRFIYSQVLCAVPLLLYSLSYYANKKEKSKFESFCKQVFSGKTNDTIIQFIRYLFVGGIAAIVNIGMLYVFTEIFNFYYILSNILSFVLGLIVNYILSKKMVFQEDVTISKNKEFMIYAMIGIVGLGFDTLLVWILTDVIHIYYMLSKIISTLLVFIWNFVARKLLYKFIK